MRIGLIARADNTGLGVQTWEFYRHIKPEKTMVVDISALNHNRQFDERYADGNVMFVRGWPNYGDCAAFLEGLDVVFTAETPYCYDLYKIAQERGIVTVQQYNWEFLDYHKQWIYYDASRPLPSVFAAPTPWHFEDLEFDNKMLLPVPVDRERCAFVERDDPTQFLHIAGNPAANDRNGTETVLDAVKFVTNPNYRLFIRVQKPEFVDAWRNRLEPGENRVEFIYTNEDNYWDIYSKGNTLVMPRRFGGLCLPVNEALSCGTPVIMTNITPNNDLLPMQWLVGAQKTGEFTPRTTIDIFSASPEELGKKMDDWSRQSKGLMRYANVMAGNIAATLDWKVWENKYREAFAELCHKTK